MKKKLDFMSKNKETRTKKKNTKRKLNTKKSVYKILIKAKMRIK